MSLSTGLLAMKLVNGLADEEEAKAELSLLGWLGVELRLISISEAVEDEAVAEVLPESLSELEELVPSSDLPLPFLFLCSYELNTMY